MRVERESENVDGFCAVMCSSRSPEHEAIAGILARRSRHPGSSVACKAGAAQKRNCLRGSPFGKQQTGMRCGDDAMIGQPRQFGLGDADSAVVRR